jgi:hypothetical protein
MSPVFKEPAMRFPFACCLALAMAVVSTARADLTDSLKPGTMDIKQAGTIAFGPDGVLFIGDTQQGAIYAVATGDTKGDPSKAKVDIKGIDQQVAAMLGTAAGDILINDMAVNPASGNVYLSVSRGRGASALPVVIRVDNASKLSEVKLSDAKFSKVRLGNVADSGNQRTQSITDIAYTNGKVIVAGLSNEEFASKLRFIDFPFKEADRGASVEIYHGNHDDIETRSPVRTFVTLQVNGQPTILAGYTCTPLVIFPIADLKTGTKVTGKTIAELGMGNTPLDMISYQKDGKEFLLMANTRYGIRKLATEEIGTLPAITKRVGGTAGLKFEDITSVTNVAHLAKLNADDAVVLVTANGSSELKTVPLP